MTLSTAEVRPFDVVIARVRFEEDPGKAKPRPVIVLSVSDEECTVVAVKVTSHAPREWCPGEVVLTGWRLEGLAKPSVARCSKLVRLRGDDLSVRIGELTPEDRSAVLRALGL